ncbi:MAG TPA: hypothetical protein VLA40_08495 [Rheinheimera sp.]|nr:hypothetical protein [Rheinheimera sp.]
MALYELTFRAIKSITAPEKIALSAHGFVFQNLGDRDAYINAFTVPANSTFQLAAPDRNGVILMDANITFAAGGSPLLQIGELTIDEPQFSNYVEK